MKLQNDQIHIGTYFILSTLEIKIKKTVICKAYLYKKKIFTPLNITCSDNINTQINPTVSGTL